MGTDIIEIVDISTTKNAHIYYVIIIALFSHNSVTVNF